MIEYAFANKPSLTLMDYRREIDGLRAVAVLPVILFHAGFHTFSGGFVGVDVFFVISGYLITSIIISEKQAGTFTIAKFYERRARRILPALFVVMLVCLPFSWLWLLPPDMKSFCQSLVAVSFFSSNILFWQRSGYFENSAEFNPLLHTWSLAVEEQYYLFFPLFMMLTWHLGKRWMLLILAFVGVGSLVLAQWGSTANPSAAFYLLPTRGWELLIGAFVAFYFSSEVRPPLSRSFCEVGSSVGLLLLIYAIFSFDKRTPFPSFYTLVPTVGTALIILCATPQTAIGRLLGNRLFVGLGLISYSAYLWHQPLFAFAKHRSFDPPGKLLLGTLAMVSVILAYFSWKYVEKIFRSRARFNRDQVFIFGAVGSAFFVVLGLAGNFQNGFEPRLSGEQLSILKLEKYSSKDAYRLGSCFLDDKQSYLSFKEECRVEGHDNGVMIWGDSHAAALSYGLRKTIKETIQYTAGGCPPLIGVVVSWLAHCKGINDYVLAEVQRLKPRQVYLLANWSSYNELDPVANIRKTIESIKSVSSETVITIVGPVPQWWPSMPKFLIKNNVNLVDDLYLNSNTLDELYSLDESLSSVARDTNVQFFSALNSFCENRKCLATIMYNKELSLTAWDYGHLTEAGSLFLARKLVEKGH